MCILQSLCIYYNLYAYTTISMRILQSPCVYYNLHAYTTISMCILQSLCVYYNLYAYTTISMRILWSLWKQQSALIYYNKLIFFQLPQQLLKTFRDQHYKTFYTCNSWKDWVFVPGRPFQPFIMFVGKARAKHLKSIRIGRKGLPGTNTLSYYEHS